jgi:hypothetical protein
MKKIPVREIKSVFRPDREFARNALPGCRNFAPGSAESAEKP